MNETGEEERRVGRVFTKAADLADLTGGGWPMLDALDMLGWRADSAIRYHDRHGDRATVRAIRDAIAAESADARACVRAWLAEATT